MSIKSAVQIVDATVGVAAKHMNTGEEICERGGEVFFTASTFKIPILIELYTVSYTHLTLPTKRIV